MKVEYLKYRKLKIYSDNKNADAEGIIRKQLKRNERHRMFRESHLSTTCFIYIAICS